ncbi:MAG: precorrin-2 C(20)-methyltransferase [Desulfobacterales bacterium]|nr:precorrin-2 C(20)-methyltransferase [Desulfobacterales bacterium]
MNKTKTGTLYGIGVGPGDPELITIKASKILNKVDVVFAAASTKNSYSLAVSIAGPHIPETTLVKKLSFPMTINKKETERAWKDNARTIIKELELGKDVAFLSLGDCMTYSTYGYILKHIRKTASHVNIKTIPGITSYQAAASCLNVPLVEGEESLLIVSGARGGEHLRQLSVKPECVVFLKAYRNIKDIDSAINESGLYSHSVGVLNCGHPEEEIVTDIKELSKRQPNYWTLIIAKQKKNDSTKS